MPAVLFGSISALADTSEIQRRAFNEAFTAHALDWAWSREQYRSLLGSYGGAGRIEEYARQTGTDNVDAAAVHATKSKIFQELLAESDVTARPGVVQTVEQAKADGVKLGFVTTTSRANVTALLGALESQLGANAFDLIVDSDDVDATKPDPAAYNYALEQLDVDAGEAVAIEDNVGGVQAAVAAGINCIAFPNENTGDGDFSAADETVSSLDPQTVLDLANGATR